MRKVCGAKYYTRLTSMSDISVKEMFISRVRSLLEVLYSRNSGDEESLEHDFDDSYTRANPLYHHGVRLASVHMIEESTITKLKNVIDLLTEKRAGFSAFDAFIGRAGCIDHDHRHARY